MAMHRAIEEGRDVFHERELLIGSFGRLFQRHGSGGDRVPPAPPRDRRLLARVKERMRRRTCLRPAPRRAGGQRRA